MIAQSETEEGHPIVSHDEWMKARIDLLAKEKEFTRQRDELSRERRALPWEKVEKHYVFDGPDGEKTLVDLFAGRSQLIVYHFMFAPEWDEPCESCSFWADSFNGIPLHLNQRDITFTAISRAALDKLEAFKGRMGWSFPWVSSGRTDFNLDYQASFTPAEVEAKSAFFNYRQTDPFVSDREGISVFTKDKRGEVFHTYSCYGRGIDLMNSAYNYIDLTPKGRHEDGANPQAWVNFRDRYT